MPSTVLSYRNQMSLWVATGEPWYNYRWSCYLGTGAFVYGSDEHILMIQRKWAQAATAS